MPAGALAMSILSPIARTPASPPRTVASTFRLNRMFGVIAVGSPDNIARSAEFADGDGPLVCNPRNRIHALPMVKQPKRAFEAELLALWARRRRLQPTPRRSAILNRMSDDPGVVPVVSVMRIGSEVFLDERLVARPGRSRTASSGCQRNSDAHVAEMANGLDAASIAAVFDPMHQIRLLRIAPPRLVDGGRGHAQAAIRHEMQDGLNAGGVGGGEQVGSTPPASISHRRTDCPSRRRQCRRHRSSFPRNETCRCRRLRGSPC